ncbi:hypothetical protein PK98_14705 [Croceibacterium mercuriale]|uniref:Glycosyl transferase n=2 Tax=Croceibacterium mercuriale TaxID=1572751 RepID=A0A0B2BX76_9SPHN|nr:hypothetical protein PK98_14705 [Croceibacterium mercuriale]
MLKRLCGRLAPHPIHVHIDKKSTTLSLAEVEAIPNVVTALQEVEVHWADFSMVRAAFLLLERAQQETPDGHTLLLSGSCYPLVPVEWLVRYLAQHRDRDIIQLIRVGPRSELHRLVARRWRMRPFLTTATRVRVPLVAKADDFARRLYNALTRRLGRDFLREIGGRTPHHGSSWWAISPASRDYLLELWRQHPQWFTAFESVYAVDEIFIHTLLANGERRGHQIGPTTDLGTETIYDAPLHFVFQGNARSVEDTPETRVAVERTEKFFLRKLSSCNTDLLDWIDTRADNLHRTGA